MPRYLLMNINSWSSLFNHSPVEIFLKNSHEISVIALRSFSEHKSDRGRNSCGHDQGKLLYMVTESYRRIRETPFIFRCERSAKPFREELSGIIHQALNHGSP